MNFGEAQFVDLMIKDWGAFRQGGRVRRKAIDFLADK
jgi:hypothetical protein